MLLTVADLLAKLTLLVCFCGFFRVFVSFCFVFKGRLAVISAMWLFCPVEQVLFLHVDFICGPKLLPVFSMMMMTCAERDLQCESKNYPHEVF